MGNASSSEELYDRLAGATYARYGLEAARVPWHRRAARVQVRGGAADVTLAVNVREVRG